MNEFVYLLAILVSKEVLTEDEAKKYIKQSNTGILNSNLKEMMTKAKTALEVKEDSVEKIDAKDFFKG